MVYFMYTVSNHSKGAGFQTCKTFTVAKLGGRQGGWRWEVRSVKNESLEPSDKKGSRKWFLKYLSR